MNEWCVVTLANVGYFQTIIWFWEYPWVLTSSFTFLLHARLQTWLPVSTWFSWFPLAVFQNRMQRSAVPPPETRRLLWWGDHAIAFTAAVCSVSFRTGCVECWFQTNSWLSFPPDASSRSSWDHLSPHT